MYKFILPYNLAAWYCTGIPVAWARAVKLCTVPVLEVDGDDVKLLWHHDPPHDRVDEEREENVTEEDEDSHQNPDEELLGSVHYHRVAAKQTTQQTHLRLFDNGKLGVW